MAGNQVKVVLSATDRTGGAFRSAEGRLKRLQTATASMVKTMAPLMAAAAVAGVVALGKSSLDTADKIQKMSMRLGVSTEALSQYEHVAKRAGVRFETLTMGWQRMTRRVAEAAVGMGEARAALVELEVPAVALSKLAPEKQFEVLADALAGVESPAHRVRLAMKLFDSEGVSLLQTMKTGAAGIRRVRAEFDALGGTLSQDTANAAAAANDAITNLNATTKAFGNNLISVVAPGVQSLAESLLGLSSGLRTWDEFVKFSQKFPELRAQFDAWKDTMTDDEFIRMVLDHKRGMDGLTASLLDFQMVIRDSQYRGGMPFADQEVTTAAVTNIGAINAGLKDLTMAGSEMQWVTAEALGEFENRQDAYAFLASLNTEAKKIPVSMNYMADASADALYTVESAAMSVGDSITNSMTAAILDSKKAFVDLQSVAQTVLSSLFKYGLSALVQYNTVGFGSPALGMLADGGAARAGKPYVVGERGPELFVPETSGTVIPNGQAAGATVTNQVTVNVDGSLITDPLAFRAFAEKVQTELDKVNAKYYDPRGA